MCAWWSLHPKLLLRDPLHTAFLGSPSSSFPSAVFPSALSIPPPSPSLRVDPRAALSSSLAESRLAFDAETQATVHAQLEKGLSLYKTVDDGQSGLKERDAHDKAQPDAALEGRRFQGSGFPQSGLPLVVGGEDGSVCVVCVEGDQERRGRNGKEQTKKREVVDEEEEEEAILRREYGYGFAAQGKLAFQSTLHNLAALGRSGGIGIMGQKPVYTELVARLRKHRGPITALTFHPLAYMELPTERFSRTEMDKRDFTQDKTGSGEHEKTWESKKAKDIVDDQMDGLLSFPSVRRHVPCEGQHGQRKWLLMLTASMDWSVKIWACEEKEGGEIRSKQKKGRVQGEREDQQMNGGGGRSNASIQNKQQGKEGVKMCLSLLRSFTSPHAAEAIFDVQWSPTHPCVFASCSGTGSLQLWDLSHSLDQPVISLSWRDFAGVKPAFMPQFGHSAAACEKEEATSGEEEVERAQSNETERRMAERKRERKKISKWTQIRQQRRRRPRALTRMDWSEDGEAIVVGDSVGRVRVFTLPRGLVEISDDEERKVRVCSLFFLSHPPFFFPFPLTLSHSLPLTETSSANASRIT